MRLWLQMEDLFQVVRVLGLRSRERGWKSRGVRGGSRGGRGSKGGEGSGKGGKVMEGSGKEEVEGKNMSGKYFLA